MYRFVKHIRTGCLLVFREHTNLQQQEIGKRKKLSRGERNQQVVIICKTELSIARESFLDGIINECYYIITADTESIYVYYIYIIYMVFGIYIV